jgi:hypothetical protein
MHQVHGEFIKPDQRRYSEPRRRLEPTANIAAVINDEISKGVKHPRFTLTAAFDSGATQTGGSTRSFRNSATPQSFEVDVVLTDPSVTDDTSFSVNGGESKSANSTIKFLVADHQSPTDTDFVILAVDEESGTVKGIVQKGTQLVKWVQDSGGVAVVSDASFDPPQDWTCDVNVVEQGVDIATRRHLEENQKHDHDDSHHHHDHHHHGHGHDSFKLGNIADFAAQLGIEKVNLQSRRRMYATDTFPNAYSYQVDLYIEVDTAMVTTHDPNDAQNMPNTIIYINALITAISTIVREMPGEHLLSCLYLDLFVI